MTALAEYRMGLRTMILARPWHFVVTTNWNRERLTPAGARPMLHHLHGVIDGALLGSERHDMEAKPPASAGAQQGERPARKGKWPKGQSGNPAGRQPGSKNRISLEIQQLLDRAGLAITARAVKMALEGNPAAMKLVLPLVAGRERPILVDGLTTIDSPADALAATGRILAEAAAGRLTPRQSDQFGDLIRGWLSAWGATELERRICELEGKKGEDL